MAVGLGSDVKLAILCLQTLHSPFCQRISQPATNCSPEKPTTHFHFYHRFPLWLTVECLVYRVRADGRKWEYFTAARFRSILGGRWDSIDLSTLYPYHSVWLPERNHLGGHRSLWGEETSSVLALQPFLTTSRPHFNAYFMEQFPAICWPLFHSASYLHCTDRGTV